MSNRPRCTLLSAAAWLASALLPGCQPTGPEALYQEYHNRLARTLAVAPPAPVPRHSPPLPRPGQLRLAIAPGKLGALDFLALSGCAVQITIGKSNSSLGRMASASQRLLLSLEYLALAPECIQSLRQRQKPSLASVLEQAWQQKRRQLPGLIFNATLAGREYRQFWRRPAAAPQYPAATGSQVISALEAINGHARRWLAGDYRADNGEFEILLGEVATGDGGALLNALAAQGAWLAASDQILESRLARGPLCAPNYRPAAADILPNVVRRYLVGAVQPRAAALGRRHYQLLPAITILEALLGSALPANYRSWMEARNDLLQAMVQAPSRHVSLLQLLYQPCGELSGRPGPGIPQAR